MRHLGIYDLLNASANVEALQYKLACAASMPAPWQHLASVQPARFVIRNAYISGRHEARAQTYDIIYSRNPGTEYHRTVISYIYVIYLCTVCVPCLESSMKQSFPNIAFTAPSASHVRCGNMYYSILISYIISLYTWSLREAGFVTSFVTWS